MTADIVIPKSGTDIKFTYLMPEEFEADAEVGKAVLVPFKNRTLYGFIYGIRQDDNDRTEEAYVESPQSKYAGKIDKIENKKIKLKRILRISKPCFFDESRKDIFNFLSSYYHENISGVFEAVLPSLDVKHFDLLDKYYDEAMFLEAAGKRESGKNDLEDTPYPAGRHKFLSDAPYNLTQEQENAVSLIRESMGAGLYKTFLLHGVTASGKTEIYFNLLDFALNLNKQVIITVPEIFITNQFIYLIKKRFKTLVENNCFAVFHSKISSKEKLINHIRIMNGGVKLILGARSAIFSPLKNPGLIIIDEEHDASYKQQSGLLYNARDVAVMMSKKSSSVCVLGSATPSLESYYNATALKKYEYIYIKNRVSGKSLPQVNIIDLKPEFKSSGKREFKNKVLSDETILLIKENIKNKKQILLFLNRRGFSTFLICSSCGHLFLCKNCAISLVHHKNKHKKEENPRYGNYRDINAGSLECHYCGYTEDVPKLCPECGMDAIEPYGVGVQKLEDGVKTLFGGTDNNADGRVRIERIDSDIAKSKKAGAEIFKKMHRKEIDILIGTQIITKGHDFPDVGLVVVIFADGLMNIPDFRSAEKAFQILTQVLGRAGRGKDRGEIAVQTFIPDNYLLQYTASHDTKGFYEKELEIRKEYGYPPYTKIIALKLIDKNIETLKETALNLKKIIGRIIEANINSGNFANNISILGPSPCPIEKIKNDFRYQLILKAPPPAVNLHRLINMLRMDERLSKNFSSEKISVDVDPDVLM
jgi:primosomal protein N' (replication factor Y)